MNVPRPRISAFVISYNRAEMLGSCLRGLAFADEIVVIDKSSSDQTRDVAGQYADQVITVPWSPTVEETRAFALSKCRHEWVLFLDDDEVLSPEAVQFLRCEMEAPRADIYALPLRHYVLGVHDERAYYWPEHHVRCFRRGTVSFSPTVHAGIELLSDRVMRVAPDAGVCIHHLSHPDVASWIERTNRYTARPDRARVSGGPSLAAFAHDRINHWMERTRDEDPDGYPAAVALLRAVYDMVDRLKTWEEAQGGDGSEKFRQLCAALDLAHANSPMNEAKGRGESGCASAVMGRIGTVLARKRLSDAFRTM